MAAKRDTTVKNPKYLFNFAADKFRIIYKANDFIFPCITVFSTRRLLLSCLSTCARNFPGVTFEIAKVCVPQCNLPASRSSQPLAPFYFRFLTVSVLQGTDLDILGVNKLNYSYCKKYLTPPESSTFQ